MRWNSVGLDQMERCMCQKNEGNQYQIKPAHQLSSMEGNNLMVWKCMGWNEVGVQGKMDAEQYCEVLIEWVEESLETLDMAENEW